jgi:hypothetical protein
MYLITMHGNNNQKIKNEKVFKGKPG